MDEVGGKVTAAEVLGWVYEVGGCALGSAPTAAFAQGLPGTGAGLVVSVKRVAVGGAELLSVGYDFGGIVTLLEGHDAGGYYDEACWKAMCLGYGMGVGKVFDFHVLFI